MKLTNVIIILFFSCIAATLALAADSLAQKNQQLNQVSEQIKGLQQNLLEEKTQRNYLLQALETIELNINLTSNQLAATDHHLKYQISILSELENKKASYQQQLQSQQLMLGRQVRAEYMLGKHQYLKLLLNQQNPEMVSRLVTYYQYISKARIKIIAMLNETLQEISDNEQQIQDHTNKLQQLYTKQTNEKNNLQFQLDHRKIILANLNAIIETKSQRLAQLQVNKKALEDLIDRLKQQQMQIIAPKVPFAAMHGKLPWPTQGKIIENFAYKIDSSDLTFNGIFIQAPIGQPIRAVYPGKVVFANWLRGVGLLIIINHADGFMTLYGHEHSINVKVGSYVRSLQVIGTVGETGGVANSGLYFQIREHGKPLDPQKWLT